MGQEESGPMEPTATVIVRYHSDDCPYPKALKSQAHAPDKDATAKAIEKAKGKCTCPKSLLVYDGATRNKKGRLVNRIVSAKTRSWSKAEKNAQDWLDQFDPDKVELKSLRAQKERQRVRIEDAVALYLADMVARLGDNGTVRMARSLFGHVNTETKQVERDGLLFAWLDQQFPRPVSISEITPALLTQWRASWK